MALGGGAMPENVVLCHMWLLRTIYSN